MTNYLLVAILLLFIGYGLVEAWPLITGPSLSIEFPPNNATFPGGIVTVRGTAARIAQLTLDGAPVLHEEDGSFSTVLTFPHGASQLTFAATDLFGRRVTAARTIFVP